MESTKFIAFPHPFLSEAPAGEQSLILNGVPNVAGSFNINVLSSNQWGTSDQNFTLNIQAIAPEIQTLPPLQVGSTSAQLRGYLYNIGGENTQVSFEYGTNSLALDSNTTQQIINQNGEVSYLLSGLSKGTTYYYKSWASNSAGISMGDALSTKPKYDWPLQSITGGGVAEMNGIAPGTTGGNTSVFVDGERGNVIRFDGEDDFISFGDLDDMDSPLQFTLSVWFKRKKT